MSVLLVDLGNSRWKIARTVGCEIGPVHSGTYDDLAGLRLAAVPGEDLPQQIMLASVVNAQATQKAVAVLQRMLGVSVRQISSADHLPGVVSGYRKPEQLGIDRLLAMVAVRARTSRPFCVIDAGTAITVDFVDAQGFHLGGFILPGLRMFRDCLLANTSIPRDAEIDQQAVLGRDTPTAVALAARYAVAGLVERFTVGSASLFPDEQAPIFLGGGDAEAFIGLLPQACIRLGDLVLRGLAVVAAGGEC